MKCAPYHPVLSNPPNPISREFCHHGRCNGWIRWSVLIRIWLQGCFCLEMKSTLTIGVFNRFNMRRQKKREMPPTTNILHPFSVLTTGTQLLIRQHWKHYSAAAVKTLESAVNHDRCSNTMKPLAFGDQAAGKYKRCCSSLAIITFATTSGFPIFVQVKDEAYYIACKIGSETFYSALWPSWSCSWVPW